MGMGKERCCDEDVLPLVLLGEDDFIQILVWLPVVSLLRFKTVCKSWCTLIESSFFIDLHTSTTLKSYSSKFGSFIFHVSNYKYLREGATVLMLSSSSGSGCRPTVTAVAVGGEDYYKPDDYYVDDVGEVFMLDNNNLRGGGGGSNEGDDDNDQLVVFKLDNLGIPSCYKFSDTPRIIGSCNGLICLLDGQHMYDKQQQQQPHMDFSLWNPATRQFRILPKSITIEKADGRHLVAFGFDAETKDYKVLLVTGFRPQRWFGAAPLECLCQVQVYSLSTDSWRLLEGITSLPGFPSNANEGLYLNGCCFFIRFLHSEPHEENNDRFIISFDFTKEIITTIPLPDHVSEQELYLSCLGDQMALFIVCSGSDDETAYYNCSDFDIWVLNEHGCSAVNKKESWTKLHYFRIKSRLAWEVFIPKGISNDGEFALVESLSRIDVSSKKMKLYNLVTKQVKKNFLSCNTVLSITANAYKPSLVPIMGGNGTTAARS